MAAAAGSEADVAQATSSLAQVLLRTDRPREARDRAHEALALLAGRIDFIDFLAEIGNAQLVVAKSHAAELDTASASEWLDHAERTFTELGSTSQLAAVWITRGDLARATGDGNGAAELYRRAAESLQDFHF